MRTVVDALLRRLAGPVDEAANPITDEEGERAKAAELSGHHCPGNTRMAAIGPATDDQGNRSPGTSDRQGSLSQPDPGAEP